MATDEARRLLDTLMGTQRNASVKEVQRRKGENFKDERVCKFYLLGFCPMHERIFASTRRNLGACNKIHSDALREEFEKHPDRQRYEERYESQLRSFLGERIREADLLAASERRKALKVHQFWAHQMLAEAERLAEANNLAASREKAERAEKVRKYAEEAERNRQLLVPEVCEVCGIRAEFGDEGHMAAHLKGKVHFGYLLLRQRLKQLQEKRPKLRNYPRLESTDSSRALLREANMLKESDEEGADDGEERSKAKEKHSGRGAVEERSVRYDRKRKADTGEEEEEEEQQTDGRRKPGWRDRHSR